MAELSLPLFKVPLIELSSIQLECTFYFLTYTIVWRHSLQTHREYSYSSQFYMWLHDCCHLNILCWLNYLKITAQWEIGVL